MSNKDSEQNKGYESLRERQQLYGLGDPGPLDVFLASQHDPEVAEITYESLMEAIRLLKEGESPLCQADKDGDCIWEHCPQLQYGEPGKTGRHCTVDTWDLEERR